MNPRRTTRRLMGAWLAATIVLSAASVGAEVEELKNGIYSEVVKTKRMGPAFVYVADLTAQLFFVQMVGNGTLTPVPCEHLARRPGWAPVLS